MVMVFIGKSDMRSAFHNLGMMRKYFPCLMIKAKSPIDGQTYYFVDKCLPFGASISCAHFQNFSDAIAHIIRTKTGKDLINYLDDYLFASFLECLCDGQIQQFLKVCEMINFPVSIEKTYWGHTTLVFLGLLIDTIRRIVCIPCDKIKKTLDLIEAVLASRKHKVTMLQIQQLCGYLNFIGRGIIPGQTFTRRLYALTASSKKGFKLKQHHHIRLKSENLLDLELWQYFLKHPTVYCRPFLDFKPQSANKIPFYTDASKCEMLGAGGWCDNEWFSLQWPAGFIKKYDPSIAYLELYAVTIGVKLWLHKFRNTRIIINCDNQATVQMLNNNSSSCKYCMKLIRVIVLECLIQNVKVFAQYVNTKANGVTDSLSRLDYARFHQLMLGWLGGVWMP